MTAAMPPSLHAAPDWRDSVVAGRGRRRTWYVYARVARRRTAAQTHVVAGRVPRLGDKKYIKPILDDDTRDRRRLVINRLSV